MEKLTQLENAQIEIQDRFSKNTADSEQFRTSQIEESWIQKQGAQTMLGYSVFQKIWNQQIEQPEVSSNVHRGAISWLIKTCWSKNYQDDVLWSSIAFYYSYKSSILIQKSRLVLILSTCLYLSAKLHSSQSQTIKNILLFGEASWKAADIQEIQYQLLNLLDFQPYFQTPLQQFLIEDGVDLNQKVLFLAQTLMFNSVEPVFNRLLLSQIKQLCENPQLMNSSKAKILSILKNKKQTDCLIKKYIPKFDVQKFIQVLKAQTSES